ncbi:glycosyltransferase [Sulfurisphaera ohwakuensis]|uniref:Glycosyltransferase n=1 Tax=Sulfurisphaera ohwakuensis TaxID=69656 RepID=A0A650CIT0_SULOH|nr:glycosyltransferase [Sulfurisphaera ohwakuensis]MBB5254992.1 glycosyltransferase involved in cell wall biosynthesis [Sulfurisphaera ohwakuensis]QGR17638.1 glycosyltransferase [Sulfurisphaera ohwakuensis]
MKITIITSLTSNYSGGSTHVNNVVYRLTRHFEVEFIPSINFFVNNPKAEEELENIQKKGVKIPEFVYSLSLTNLKPSFLPYSPSVYKTFAEKVKLDSDFIYDPDYTTPESVFISNINKIPLGLTLHEPLYSFSQSVFYTYYSLKPFFFNSMDYFVKRSIALYLLTRRKREYIKQAKYLNFIAGVSKGTLDSVKVNKVKKYLLQPGNGVDRELLNYRTRDKEDYVVFWTTLIPPKGILNFVYVLKLLKNRGIKVKAKVAGKFLYEKFKNFFFKYVKDNSLDIEYLGFIEKKKLYEVASKARLLIYPSLADGFSLTILEALALGTPVIAYSIPTVHSVYKDIPAVRFVKEGNVNKMAEEVKKELNKGELLNAVFSDKVRSFIEFHNWDNVTESIAKILKEEIEQRKRKDNSFS